MNLKYMAVQINNIKSALKTAFQYEMENGDSQSIDRISDAIANIVANAIVQGINTAVVSKNLKTPNDEDVTGTITITASAE